MRDRCTRSRTPCWSASEEGLDLVLLLLLLLLIHLRGQVVDGGRPRCHRNNDLAEEEITKTEHRKYRVLIRGRMRLVEWIQLLLNLIIRPSPPTPPPPPPPPSMLQLTPHPRPPSPLPPRTKRNPHKPPTFIYVPPPHISPCPNPLPPPPHRPSDFVATRRINVYRLFTLRRVQRPRAKV